MIRTLAFDTINPMQFRPGRRSILFACLSLCSCGISLKKPLTVLIPEGYSGWVRVEFNVTSAPAYAQVDGQRVLRIPASGFAQTSSTFEPGNQGDVYEYMTAEGKPEAFPAGISMHLPRMFTVNALGEKQRIFGAFFVGTDAAFAKATKDPSSLPLPKD